MSLLHTNRILVMLGDAGGPRTTSQLPLTQPLWNHYSQWKWFYREIGKQNCILALLPLAETALHISQAPLPPEYPPEYCSPMETREALSQKIHRVKQWAERPTKRSKDEIMRLPSHGPRPFDMNFPTSSAAGFINALVHIVMAEANFNWQVHRAFQYFRHMGFGYHFAEVVFLTRVRSIYRAKAEYQGHNPPT